MNRIRNIESASNKCASVEPTHQASSSYVDLSCRSTPYICQRSKINNFELHRIEVVLQKFYLLR